MNHRILLEQVMNKGRLISTKPLTEEVIQSIKEHLQDDARSLSYFVVSVNSGCRVGDLLSMKREHLTWKDGLATFEYLEGKTKKRRIVPLNASASQALARWMEVHPRKTDFIWEGTRGQQRSSYYSTLMKRWVEAVGADSTRIANHSLRKSFTAINIRRGHSLTVLQKILNHSSPMQTMEYACIMQDDMAKVYASAI